MPTCIYCGEEVETNAPKCPNCGKNFWKNIESDENNKNKIKKIFKNSSRIPSASPIKRLIAGLIDFVIVVGLTIFVYLIIAKGLDVTGKMNKLAILGSVNRWLRLKTLLLFLPPIYVVLKDSLFGKSIGKLLMKLTTINTDNQMRSGIVSSILRNSLFSIVAIPLIGWILFIFLAGLVGIQIAAGNRIRLGDRFADTIVIDDKIIKKKRVDKGGPSWIKKNLII